MPKEILLLTEAIEAPTLIPLLSDARPGLTVTHVENLEQLNDACRTRVDGRRLIAFCTPVIIPGAVLNELDGPAYNFHPGPPSYPGLYPSCFAIYDGARRFGATAHVLTRAIDAGPIIDVEWAEIPPTIDRLNLEALSHQLVVNLFRKLVSALVNSEPPLAPLPVTWSGRPTSRRDFERLCEVPHDVSAYEFRRRHRAVGEGHEHAMFVFLHGRRFRIENLPGDGNVYMGGQIVSSDRNSPLKKASLTGFHATAKHIAAKAVSPSSETMRTI